MCRVPRANTNTDADMFVEVVHRVTVDLDAVRVSTGVVAGEEVAEEVDGDLNLLPQVVASGDAEARHQNVHAGRPRLRRVRRRGADVHVAERGLSAHKPT